MKKRTGACRSVDRGFANIAIDEHGRGFDIIPFLLGERVHHFFLGTLLTTLCETLILADGHGATVPRREEREKKTEDRRKKGKFKEAVRLSTNARTRVQFLFALPDKQTPQVEKLNFLLVC